MADPKAALAEIQKKYGGGTTESTSRTSRSTGSAAGAKDALAAIQQKYAPQTRTASSYQSQNAGHERSGLTRDEYDSRVRSGYAERAAAGTKQSAGGKYNTGSVLELGYGPISTERLEQLITTGAVTAQERNGQTYVSRAQQATPARPGLPSLLTPSALTPSIPSSFTQQPAAAPAAEKKGYYSQPENIGADTDRLKTAATEMEPAVTKKYEALQSANDRALGLESSLKFIEGHLQTLYSNYEKNPTQGAAQLYENAYASYEQKNTEYEEAVNAYNTAYQEYAPLYDQYSSATAAYNSYIESQQAMFGDWKSTIRAAEQIQVDEDALGVQIKEIKAQQKALNDEATQLMNMISNRLVGYGQMEGISQQANEKRAEAKALQPQIDELENGMSLLKEEREWAEHYKYADLMETQDWQKLSTPTAAKREADDLNLWKIGQKRGDDKYDFINDIDDYRQTVGALSFMTQQQNEYGDYSQYSYINEEEAGIYNYLYAKQGKEAADEYLDYLEETLNYRWGLATAEGKDTDFERIMWAVPSGLDRFGTGIAQLFSKEDLPTTYTQYASQAVRQELGGVSGVAYDFIQTMSNMAPSILLSVATSGLASGLGAGAQIAATAGKVLGTGSMSLSAAGNAYNEKVKAGYDPDEARTYAALVGASEGLLQYLLGGISKLGTGVNGGLLAQKIAGIDSAFGRIAANWGYSMFKEGMEEGLQEVLEPVFSSLIFNEEYDPAAMEEVAYSFLLGAMSAGLLEGGDVVRTDANTRGTGAQFREMGDDVVQSVIDTGLESGKNTASYKIAMELQAKLDAGQTITDYELGRLYGENVQTVAAEEKTQRQSQRAEVNEFLNAQPEAADAEVQGIVLPTAEDIYGKADTGSALPQTPAQRSSMLREPGMLPTAEDAELQQRMANAKTETERSGIEAGANDEAIAQATRLSSTLGRDIVFYNEAASGTGIKNGRYENGTIYVNANSPNPLAQIISHELTHSVEMADAYKDLSGIVMNKLSQTGRNVEQLRQAKMELYARNGHPLSEADADAEIVAEYVEKYLLTDERSIMQITRENKTLAQRILGWIDDLLAKLGNASAQERAFLMRARDTYASALQQSQSSFNADTAAAAPAAQAGTQTTAASTQETTLEQLRTAWASGEMTDAEFDAALEVIMQEESTADESMLEVKHSFGGANANGADLDALRKAQQMQAQGVAPETIFRETGWHTGADGKWRFEIDDSGMNYDTKKGMANHSEAKMLSYYLEHSGLFKAYPQLRNASMEFADIPENVRGEYDVERNTIRINRQMRYKPEEIKDTLVHEIQHAIQKAEGFAKGSSPEYWANDAGKTKRAEAVERIQSEISSLEGMLDDGSEADSEDFIRADIEELKEKLDTLSFHLYQNTAGEVEARDAARRRRMTPEQRRQTMPDTGDENTVFAEDADEDLQAIGRTTDDRPFVTVEEDILDGVPEADWIDTVRENLKKKFPNGVTVGNSDIKIDGQSRREMTFSGYMQWLYNNDPQLREDKLRATNNADEILRATTGWVDEGLHHPRKDRILDFARGNVLLRVGNNDYSADVVVGTRKNGTMVLYDVLNLQPTSFTKRETGAAKSTNPSPGAARSTAQVSGDIIREGTGDVNGLPVKEQFSITEPVEQTQTLLALHNMDEEKLRRTLNLGAWPSPSIAIVEAAQGHSNYGEYSAVFPRSVIDPEADSRNKVYGSDAWTPTWRNAQIEYEVNYDKKSALERRIAELSKNVANGIFSRSSVISSRVDDTSGMDAKALAERLAGDDTVRAAYLAETGGTLEPVLKSKEWNKYGNGVLQTLIDEIGVQELARINAEMEAGEDRIAPVRGVEDTVRQILRDDYERKFRDMLDRKPESKQKRLDSYIENNVSIFTAESIVRDAWRMYEAGGATKGEIDRNATQDELREATNEEDVAAWVLGQMDGLLGEPGIYNNKEPYTASGNRRSFKALHYDYNAENIVRAMNEAAARGEGYWGAGAEGMMAMVTPEYANVDEMHADEARLYTETEEQRKERFAKLDNEIMQIISEVKRTTKAHSDSSYQESDIVGGILMQTATEQKTEKGVKRAFAKEGYAISDVLAKRIADMYREAAQIPTGYFEAKPQRVVDFDEALAVLAPTDAPAELVAALRNAGMNVMEYNAGDEQSRLEVINSIDGAKFSISEDGAAVPEAQLPTAEDTDVISTLPVKAQDYLKRAERTLVSTIGNALSVPKFARREYLNGIVREISTEYMESGTVSQETIDRLFDRAYDEGVEVDSEYYDKYKDIKDHLRTQAITISERDKGDIADFNDFRKSAFGTLRIVNDGGLPVDVAYMELQGMAGEMFPEDITHPADQLTRMYEVARSIEKTERSLDEYYGRDAEEFRKWAKNDFDVAVNNALSELRNVKRFVDERAQSASGGGTPTTQAEVTEMYGQLKDARRTYEKAAAKNLLTQHDEVQVGRLLRGEIEPQNLDPAADNVKGITAVYEAKQEYERLTKLIREYNRNRKATLREEADGYLETANDWKDKKSGAYYMRETMERNMVDIAPKDEAKAVNERYFKPVHDAQAKSAVTKNKYRDRVRALNLSRKIAKGNTVSEAHAVQLLGEAEDNIRMMEQSRWKMKERDGKSLADWRGIVDNLWLENPKLDKAKIDAAITEFRSIYDELFQQMNESRLRNGYEPVNYRKGYFPHFQPGEGDGILAQFGKALGIDTQVTALPTTINGLTHTFKPGIRWIGNALERIGFDTVYDAVEGFDKYIEGVADVIHQTDNIQSLRALASQIRYRTGDEGIRKQVDAVLADTSLSEQDKQNRIDKIYESGKYRLSNFVVELEEYTNLLANKKSRADRNMEQALGRNMYNLMKTLESRVAANMVAVNPASWLTNFIPLTQGGAQLDRGMLLKGMWDTLRAYKTDDGIVSKSTFLTNRRGSDPIVRTWAQSASAKLSSPMEYIDQFTADTLVRARYQQNIKKGLSETEAITEADAWVAGVMADRSKGSMPTLFHRSNPLTKIFTQFQLEVNNQLSYLFKDIPREQKDKGMLALTVALLKFFIGAYLYNELYEYIIGRRPALDPLGILNDTVGNITGYELPNLMELGVGAITGDMPSFEVEKKSTYETVKGLAGSTAEELPFIGGILGGGRVPISSALPDWDNLLKAATSENWSDEKKAATWAKELGNPLTYLALPFGGGQLKKIYQGLRAVIEGGSYSVDADGNDILQYPVYNDSALDAGMNALRAATFGKTSLPTAQEWIESDFKSFGAKETAVYQGMTEAGVPDEEAHQLLRDMRGVQKPDEESAATLKRRILQESDIDGAGKSVAYYGLMASEKERALMDAITDMDADMGEVANALMEIKDADSLTGAAASNAKRDAIAQTSLTDEEKHEIYRYMMGDKQADGTYTSSRDDDIEAMRSAGMDFNQFIEAQNAYTSINEEYRKAGDKATEFSRWVNGQMYTAEQAEIVKDSFTYFSQIPAEAGRYDGFMAAGLSDEASYELTGALSALEPEDGKDTVSSLQRYRAVVDAELSADEQMAAFSTLMDESEYARVQTGYSFGVTPSAYVSAKEMLPMFDQPNKNGNYGTYTQDEIAAALDSFGTSTTGGIMLPGAEATGTSLTNAQKAVLWQLLTGSTSAKNNPYSTAIGSQVLDAVSTAKGTAADAGSIVLPGAENDTETTGGIVLPMY